jgi:hypothetical protein
MPRTIILNESNLVANGNNNTLVYRFPVGGTSFKNMQVAVSSIQLYKSWFSINRALYNNASFQYVWVDGTTYTCTLDDGYYTVSDINKAVAYSMLQQKTYLLNSSTGEPTFFFEFQPNAVKYAMQLNVYPMSAALATTNSWVLPVGATWSIPTVSTAPQVIVGEDSATWWA